MNENALQGAGSTTSADIKTGEIKSENAAIANADNNIGNIIPAANAKNNNQSSHESSKLSAQSEFEGEDLYNAILSFINFSYIESTIFSDGSSRKIDCFVVDKSVMDKSGCMHYIYGKDITSINITQTMSSYGISASIDITDTLGTVSSILERQSNFYFVIAILDIINEEMTIHVLDICLNHIYLKQIKFL